MEYVSWRIVYVSLHIRNAKKLYKNNLYFQQNLLTDQVETIIIVYNWIEQHTNMHANIEKFSSWIAAL